MAPDRTPTRDELHSLLAFYQAAGLDFAVADEAPDRFDMAPFELETVAKPKKPVRAAPPPPPAGGEKLRADAEIVAMAEQAAASAGDLDGLLQAVSHFDACPLKAMARATIFEAGTRGAPVMIVSGAPSRDDDMAEQGLSGPQGRMLEAMLAGIGIDVRAGAYHGYCVPWIVPGGGEPEPRHLAFCKPFLLRQIALARPQAVLLLGTAAARALTGSTQSIMALRGRWLDVTAGDHGPRALATHHPAVLINEPGLKRTAWLDLLTFKGGALPGHTGEKS